MLKRQAEKRESGDKEESEEGQQKKRTRRFEAVENESEEEFVM